MNTITNNITAQFKKITLFFSSLFLLLNVSVCLATQPVALLLDIDGAIGPATQDYIHRGINIAQEKKASVVILRMDTPGGLDKSMRGIIKDIIASPIPIVTYVAPSGARAASAGTYILYASHIAAMAPGTNLGAASPVQIGGEDETLTNKDKKESKESSSMSTSKAKMTNDAIAYIKGLAKLRNRNAEWGEKAVKEAASLSAEEALKLNVINLIAADIPNLLNKINGSKVEILGQNKIINTANATIVMQTPDWRTRFLAVITDPSVAYILLLIGIYGLFFEFANPGFVLPGVAGAIALLLALYAFQLLPINYAGVGLMLLGIAFLSAEAFMPSFGVLGIGGIIAFVAGSILLLDTSTPGFTINWALIFSMAIVNAAFFIGVLSLAIKSRRFKPITGSEELLGMAGIATEDFDKEGWVWIHSENWQAHTRAPIKKGQKVKVVKIEGLILYVEPIIGDK